MDVTSTNEELVGEFSIFSRASLSVFFYSICVCSVATRRNFYGAASNDLRNAKGKKRCNLRALGFAAKRESSLYK